MIWPPPPPHHHPCFTLVDRAALSINSSRLAQAQPSSYMSVPTAIMSMYLISSWPLTSALSLEQLLSNPSFDSWVPSKDRSIFPRLNLAIGPWNRVLCSRACCRCLPTRDCFLAHAGRLTRAYGPPNARSGPEARSASFPMPHWRPTPLCRRRVSCS